MRKAGAEKEAQLAQQDAQLAASSQQLQALATVQQQLASSNTQVSLRLSLCGSHCVRLAASVSGSVSQSLSLWLSLCRPLSLSLSLSLCGSHCACMLSQCSHCPSRCVPRRLMVTSVSCMYQAFRCLSASQALSLSLVLKTKISHTHSLILSHPLSRSRSGVLLSLYHQLALFITAMCMWFSLQHALFITVAALLAALLPVVLTAACFVHHCGCAPGCASGCGAHCSVLCSSLRLRSWLRSWL